MRRIADWPQAVDPLDLPDALLRAEQPWVLRGVAAQWPAVQAAKASPQAIADYLQGFWQGATVGLLQAPPEAGGRFFYADDSLSSFNFQRHLAPLPEVLKGLLQLLEHPAPPAVYVGSTTVDTTLPGFLPANRLGLGERDALISLWLGNRSRIAAHFDVPDNLAVVVAGRRRFTLFPPEQLANLYVGPLEPTPAGQPVSLVDFAAPDLQRFPRAALAMAAGLQAELGPGDALFIPSMWWHQIEALEGFNLLVNAWWREAPAWMDTPVAALQLALMSIRELPAAQRKAWQAQFQHYVFDAEAQPQIPAAALGLLGPLDESQARQARAQLLKRLNR